MQINAQGRVRLVIEDVIIFSTVSFASATLHGACSYLASPDTVLVVLKNVSPALFVHTQAAELLKRFVGRKDDLVHAGGQIRHVCRSQLKEEMMSE